MSLRDIFNFSDISNRILTGYQGFSGYPCSNEYWNFNQFNTPSAFADNSFQQFMSNNCAIRNASDSLFSFSNTNIPATFSSIPMNFSFSGNNFAPTFNFSAGGFDSFSRQVTPSPCLSPSPSPTRVSISAPSSVSLTTPSNNTTGPIIPSSGTYTQRVVQLARNYERRVKTRSYANQLFSKGQDRMWCSDFVGSVVNDVYGNKIKGLPRMGCVKDIWDWGNGKCNLTTYGMDPNQKGKYIAQNIKPGDIMINRTWYYKDKHGRKFDKPKHIFSHTEIVVEVHADGSFRTVSGGGKGVRYVNHSPNEQNLYGFTCLNRYAA